MHTKMKLNAIFLSWAIPIFASGNEFSRFDVMVFPEYYFPGVMVEIQADPVPGNSTPDFRLTVPSETDSAFFTISGENEPASLEVISSGNQKIIDVPSAVGSFRLFYFFPVSRISESVTFAYELNMDRSLNEAHVMIQEPMVAEDFSLSESGSELFQDAHGLSFHRFHLPGLEAGGMKAITVQYRNTSGQTTIEMLRGLLSTDQPDMTANTPELSNRAIQRHTLPTWQPLTVLGVLAVIIGFMFHRQRRREEDSDGRKFCSSCGSEVTSIDKYCSKCGKEL